MGAASRAAEELRALVAEAEEGVGALLAALGWAAADVLANAAADKTLLPCRVAGIRHSMPATAISEHSIRCQLTARGISPQQIEARPPSATFLYQDAPGVVSSVQPLPLVHATALATAPGDIHSPLVSSCEDEADILPAPPISRWRAQQAVQRWRAIPRRYLLCASIADISVRQLTVWVADICAELSLPSAIPELYRYVRDFCIWFSHKRYRPPDDIATASEAVYSFERGMRLLINNNVGSKAREFVLALWRRFALADSGYDIAVKAARDAVLKETAANADEETSLSTAQPDPAVYHKAMMERIEIEQRLLERLQPQAMPVARCQEHEAFSTHAQARDMAERQKSKLERLAEMRDYKRRRQRHRKAGVTRRTPTEVLRTIIDDRMHELELLAGGMPSASQHGRNAASEQPERSPTASTQPTESGWLHRVNGVDGSRESHRSRTTADERHGQQFGSRDTAHKEIKSSHKHGEHREHKHDRLSGKQEAADSSKRRRKHDHDSDRQACEDDDGRRREQRRTRYDRHDDVDEQRQHSRHRDRSRQTNFLRSDSKEVDASDRWQP
eukprot:jgi/Chlat1/6764/Chrsp50S06461